MKSSPLDEIVRGILKHDNIVLQNIYKNVFPQLRKYILRSGGNFDDAEDIFQETLLRFYDRVQKSDIQIDTSVTQYLIAIGKNVWKKKLKKSDVLRETFLSETTLTYRETSEIDYETVEMKEFLNEKLELLTPACKGILTHFYEGYSINELVEIFKLSSKEYARKKKWKCKEKLLELIKIDPRYKEFINDD